MRIISQEEQEEVRKYVRERPLVRPPITYAKAALSSLLCFFSYLLFAAIVYRLFFFATEILFSCEINAAIDNNILLVRISYVLMSLIFFCLFFAKKAAIGCVRLYQRYAPERVRRRCLLKPTCSEYAILAIEKYGLVCGIIKTWHRLNHTCRGYVYHTDYP